jgi:hypothetical protein
MSCLTLEPAWAANPIAETAAEIGSNMEYSFSYTIFTLSAFRYCVIHSMVKLVAKMDEIIPILIFPEAMVVTATGVAIR